MEIKTEPFTEELVTDLVIGFASGTIKEFTLHEGDTFKEEHHQVTVTIQYPVYPETIVFFKTHICWISSMKRIMRRAILKTKPADGTGFAETTV